MQERRVDELVASRQAVADRNVVQVASNTLSVLRMFSERKYVRLSEVQSELSVSSTTAYRLLATLEAAGLAERVPRLGYRAGATALTWAANLLANLDIRTIARPIIQRLAVQPTEAIYLAVLRDVGLVAVESINIGILPQPPRTTDTGDMRVPIHSTALGRAIAVHLEPARLALLLGPEPYPRWTDKTPTSWQALASVLHDARVRGYAVAHDDMTVGVSAVAAAIFNRSDVVASLSITGLSAHLDAERMRNAGEMVRRAADEVTHLLSARAEP